MSNSHFPPRINGTCWSRAGFEPKATADKVDALGFKYDWPGRSSKHIPFDWSGP